MVPMNLMDQYTVPVQQNNREVFRHVSLGKLENLQRQCY